MAATRVSIFQESHLMVITRPLAFHILTALAAEKYTSILCGYVDVLLMSHCHSAIQPTASVTMTVSTASDP